MRRIPRAAFSRQAIVSSTRRSSRRASCSARAIIEDSRSRPLAYLFSAGSRRQRLRRQAIHHRRRSRRRRHLRRLFLRSSDRAVSNGVQCAELHGHYSINELAARVAMLARQYNDALVAVERNNHGYAVLVSLTMGQGYTNLYQTGGQPGWVTNVVTRPRMLENFAACCRPRRSCFSVRACWRNAAPSFVIPTAHVRPPQAPTTTPSWQWPICARPCAPSCGVTPPRSMPELTFTMLQAA